MEAEQATPVDSIKHVVQSSVKIPEFDKHLKKAGEHIGRNVGNKDEDNSPKPLMIKINILYLAHFFFISVLFSKHFQDRIFRVFFSMLCV